MHSMCVYCITDVWVGGYYRCVHVCVCVLWMCEGQKRDKNS